jgi:hypothetical protein
VISTRQETSGPGGVLEGFFPFRSEVKTDGERVPSTRVTSLARRVLLERR